MYWSKGNNYKKLITNNIYIFNLFSHTVNNPIIKINKENFKRPVFLDTYYFSIKHFNCFVVRKKR